MKLLGFEFKRAGAETNISPLPTDTLDNNAAIVVDSAPGGFINSINSITLDQQSNTENEYITQYRNLLFIPEVDQCVEEIVGEAVIMPEDGTKSVTVDLSQLDSISDGTKKKIEDAYDVVYDLLMFNRKGHDIFKRWYVDGRLNYFVHIDNSNPNDGIQSVQFVDPRKIKKVREVQRQYDASQQLIVVAGEREYFIYNEIGIGMQTQQQNPTVSSLSGTTRNDAIITDDAVVYAPSGIVDPASGFVLSHLHKALRTANNLRMMEDAVLIYRLSRAPERRVFYIDTGNLPKAKAEQYVQEIANKQRSKVVYDVATGEIKNDKKYLAMTEDFWLPRREGSTGTQITTLEGGQQVGEMGESEYFKDKLYTAMNVPASRFQDQPSMFSAGTAITRDELRFSRYINRLRTNFNVLFEDMLKRQCILTGIMTADEWYEIKNGVYFKYAEDNYFAEAVKQERLQGVGNILTMLDPYVGKYFSREYIYNQVIGMTDDEMNKEKKLIAADKELQDMMSADEEGAAPKAESVIHQPTSINESRHNIVDSSILHDLGELKDSELALNESIMAFLNEQNNDECSKYR